MTELTEFETHKMICTARRRVWLLNWLAGLVTVILMISILLNVSLPNDPLVSRRTAFYSNHITAEVEEKCPDTKLASDQRLSADVTCHRLKPMRGSCKIAEELFHSTPMDTCDHQHHNSICQIVETAEGNHTVNCNQDICLGHIELEVTDATTGSLVSQSLPSISALEKELNNLIHPLSGKSHFGFCIIRCQPVHTEHAQETEWDADYAKISQLLVLPPQVDVTLSQQAKVKREDSFINVNIILLDSVSHSHFYRSLPKTVEVFRKINEGGDHSVFDFELFHAIKARTYESVQAMFSGEINLHEKPFGTYDMPPKALNVEALFEPFKKLGYRTLWLEDTCWTWEWGIVKELVVHDPKLDLKVKWQRLQNALKKASIDALDVTLSSCEILKANGKNDQFHGPLAVCYNGRHQHEYILDYLRQFEKKMIATDQPYLTYYVSNVAHEDYGRRIQTLDGHLASFLSGSVELQNTITVILSDHGNTYGKFMESTLEGRIEMFHPMLFIVVPKHVASLLGPKKMEALKTNQHRLISILDLHYTLRSLTPNYKDNVYINPEHAKFRVNTEGLFERIPPNRTCDDLPRLMPSLCICEGYEEPAPNDSQHALLAEFAVGELNNLLMDQYHQSHPGITHLGACKRLAAQRFGNIREQHYSKDNTVITKMDLFVMAKDESGMPHEEIFFITMKSSPGSDSMKLLSFERMTAYSKFQKCADTGVNIKLCVCSLDSNSSYTFDVHVASLVDNPPSMFDLYTHKFAVDDDNKNPCLYILYRTHKTGVAFEAANVCTIFRYQLEFDLQVSYMDRSASTPMSVTMEPGSIRFLLSARQSVMHKEFKWKYAVKYEGVRVT